MDVVNFFVTDIMEVQNNKLLAQFTLSNSDLGFTSIPAMKLNDNNFKTFNQIPFYFTSSPWEALWDFNFNNWTCSPNLIRGECIDNNACNPCCITESNCVAVPQVASSHCFGSIETTCVASTCTSAIFQDCNHVYEDGCEADLQNDANNCGSCGHDCTFLLGGKHVTDITCGGVCKFGACTNGHGNCNGDDSDGCEVPFDSVLNCGQCNSSCYFPNVKTPTCFYNFLTKIGTCGIYECQPNFANCDNNVTNGCELRTDFDTSNCGNCNRTCQLPNAIPQCVNSQCTIGICQNNFRDCDQNPENGCETNIKTNVTNCGECNNTCDLKPHAQPGCLNGNCVYSCDINYQDCNNNKQTDGCESFFLSNTTCGNCLNDCTKLYQVSQVHCDSVTLKCVIDDCQPNFEQCRADSNGCWINVSNDTSHCGNCVNDCTSLPNVLTTKCVGGVCQITKCKNNYADCNASPIDGCEVLLTTTKEMCGSCNMNCSNLNHVIADHVNCVSSQCILACADPYENCDLDPSNGCETNTNTAVQYCGDCSSNCLNLFASKHVDLSSVVCIDNGTCSYSRCDDNFIDCNSFTIDGCETNPLTSINHCGDCHTDCSSLMNTNIVRCTDGECEIILCTPGFVNCNDDYSDVNYH